MNLESAVHARTFCRAGNAVDLATARARNMNGKMPKGARCRDSASQRQAIAKTGNAPAFSRYPIQVALSSSSPISRKNPAYTAAFFSSASGYAREEDGRRWSLSVLPANSVSAG